MPPIRRVRLTFEWLVLGLAVATLADGGRPAAQVPPVHTLEGRVPAAPVVLTVDGRPHLVHELHVTNLRREPLELRQVTIRDERGRALVELAGRALGQSLLQPGGALERTVPAMVPPGRRAVVYVWAPIEGATPARVSHHVEVAVAAAVPPIETTVTLPGVDVSSRAAVAIDPPLAGGPWVAVYDPRLMGGHRTTLIAIDGVARIPARFAIDWIRAPEAGTAALPNAAPLRNGFGSDVLAVADGVVARLRDGAADLAPELLRTPAPLALDEGSGNYLVLDIGGGRYAVYEHLRQGSVRVTPGQRVRRGQVVAALGSSGSTSIGPHLHFHIADAASTLVAEGLPFVLRRFEALGAYASVDALVRGDAWHASAEAGVRRGEHPPAVSVLRF